MVSEPDFPYEPEGREFESLTARHFQFCSFSRQVCRFSPCEFGQKGVTVGGVPLFRTTNSVRTRPAAQRQRHAGGLRSATHPLLYSLATNAKIAANRGE